VLNFFILPSAFVAGHREVFSNRGSSSLIWENVENTNFLSSKAVGNLRGARLQKFAYGQD
jgi:hypothetical protein